MFDKTYYDERTKKLLNKQQTIINQHLENDLKFADDIRDIQVELQEISKWQKENGELDKKSDKETGSTSQSIKSEEGKEDSEIKA